MHRMFEIGKVVQPVSLQMGVQTLVLRRTVAALAAAAKVSPQLVQQITIESMEHAMWMTVSKVRTPASQHLVQPADHVRQRHPAPLRPGLLTDFLPQAFFSLPRGLDP